MMAKVTWKKSRCMRGVRDYSVRAMRGSHGVLEVEVKLVRAVLFRVSLHDSVYTKLQRHGNPLYELRRKLSGLFEYATGERCTAIYDRLVNEAVKAIVDVMIAE